MESCRIQTNCESSLGQQRRVSECPSSFQFDEGMVDQTMAIDFEMDRVAEYISRFRWRRVSIPYERRFSAAIQDNDQQIISTNMALFEVC